MGSTSSTSASPATAPARPLRVTLLHNYRDEQQQSMRLYAERLGAALHRRGVSISRVRAPGVVPERWQQRSATWAKIDTYAGRYAVYPRLVRKLEADVVHIVDHGQSYLLGDLDARRTVVTCHDLILLALARGRIGASKIPRVALQVFRVMMEFIKRAARVVADSRQTRDDLVTLVGIDPARITVIHPGLNQEFAHDPARGRATRERFGLGDGPLILQVGGVFYKNVAGALRVLGRLRRDGVDARMVRVGGALGGADRALAEKLAVLPAVVELGGVSDVEIPALYNAVDLLLFPSHYEGFGWPPLEAMASGTPVVSSRGGSLDEIVGDAALTADPEDVETLAWHAGTVLSDAATRARLVARGLAHAARFSWDRAATEMIAVYRTVAAGSS
ncbi:MAG TPA: glycosyltransferase family 1 protein [Polyangia bacterium]|jgi:glycosyltransferase involved in cell wall biosynthesis